jgi:hypothetical protein
VNGVVVSVVKVCSETGRGSTSVDDESDRISSSKLADVGDNIISETGRTLGRCECV